MNWRRGLFRFWLIGSALWIGLFGALMRPDNAFRDYMGSFEVAVPVAGGKAILTLPATATEPAQRKWLAQLIEKQPDLARHPSTLSLGKLSEQLRAEADRRRAAEMATTRLEKILAGVDLSGFEWPETPLTEAESMDFVVSHFLDDFRSAVSYRREAGRSALKVFAAVAVLPPAGFFVLGIAVGWAISGFRKV